uniref:Uncharacterized protein n=1 Tax=Chromera velia CCMP2878 TaxID=1169474 RepID=A0A0G4G0E6_9ALVE|eukprot:Cvel_19625.t1-p1 / transcript=Cvel_19625.t1 / gene=Cvel_19625 / organism=Chromera_velia_CCMP2878 / gene_product=hypothetical protein / transcript_product=hypothetical protein / location=Cvel_scaffold1708:150-2997(-) / protein_length=823 / sequence_SO=supercontig / SO=protein_coding / is_pseudo=false
MASKGGALGAAAATAAAPVPMDRLINDAKECLKTIKTLAREFQEAGSETMGGVDSKERLLLRIVTKLKMIQAKAAKALDEEDRNRQTPNLSAAVVEERLVKYKELFLREVADTHRSFKPQAFLAIKKDLMTEEEMKEWRERRGVEGEDGDVNMLVGDGDATVEKLKAEREERDRLETEYKQKESQLTDAKADKEAQELILKKVSNYMAEFLNGMRHLNSQIKTQAKPPDTPLANLAKAPAEVQELPSVLQTLYFRFQSFEQAMSQTGTAAGGGAAAASAAAPAAGRLSSPLSVFVEGSLNAGDRERLKLETATSTGRSAKRARVEGTSGGGLSACTASTSSSSMFFGKKVSVTVRLLQDEPAPPLPVVIGGSAPGDGGAIPVVKLVFMYAPAFGAVFVSASVTSVPSTDGQTPFCLEGLGGQKGDDGEKVLCALAAMCPNRNTQISLMETAKESGARPFWWAQELAGIAEKEHSVSGEGVEGGERSVTAGSVISEIRSRLSVCLWTGWSLDKTRQLFPSQTSPSVSTNILEVFPGGERPDFWKTDPTKSQFLSWERVTAPDAQTEEGCVDAVGLSEGPPGPLWRAKIKHETPECTHNVIALVRVPAPGVLDPPQWRLFISRQPPSGKNKDSGGEDPLKAITAQLTRNSLKEQVKREFEEKGLEFLSSSDMHATECAERLQGLLKSDSSPAPFTLRFDPTMRDAEDFVNVTVPTTYSPSHLPVILALQMRAVLLRIDVFIAGESQFCMGAGRMAAVAAANGGAPVNVGAESAGAGGASHGASSFTFPPEAQLADQSRPVTQRSGGAFRGSFVPIRSHRIDGGGA